MQVICHIVLHRQVYHPFENKDTIFQVEVVSDLAYELCCCVVIEVNHIPTRYVHLVQLHCDFFLGEFKTTVECQRLVHWHCRFYSKSIKRLGIVFNQQNVGTWCSDTAVFIWGFQTTEYCQNPKKYGSLVQWHCYFFGVFKQLGIVTNINFKINVSFVYGLDKSSALIM